MKKKVCVALALLLASAMVCGAWAEDVSRYYGTWKVTAITTDSEPLPLYGQEPSLCIFPDGTLVNYIGETAYVFYWVEFNDSLITFLDKEGKDYMLLTLDADGRMTQSYSLFEYSWIYGPAEGKTLGSEEDLVGTWNMIASTVTGIPMTIDGITMDLRADHTGGWTNSDGTKSGTWNLDPDSGVLTLQCEEDFEVNFIYTGLGNLLENRSRDDGSVLMSMLMAKAED